MRASDLCAHPPPQTKSLSVESGSSDRATSCPWCRRPQSLTLTARRRRVSMGIVHERARSAMGYSACFDRGNAKKRAVRILRVDRPESDEIEDS